MAKNPIIFACANPDPEITPEEIEEVRDDAIIATGRSDKLLVIVLAVNVETLKLCSA